MSRALLFLIAFLTNFSSFSQDVSVDKELGAENALLVEQEFGLYHHDSLYSLVNAVGNKLVSRLKQNPFDFKFFIADSPEPNAFALPGGYVYVTRGILLLIQTEDELAGIMAHEIIHVTERHSVKQMRKGVISGILKVPGNLVNAVTGTRLGNILNAPIDLSSKVFISKYSRGHESESDSYGIQLAASAGYKTDALADALERLHNEVALLTGKAETKSYFSDHPYTPSRVTSIRKSASLYKPVNASQHTTSTLAFLNMFNGMCYGPNPAQGIFLDSLFVHPDLGFTWRTPYGWATINNASMVSSYSEKGDALMALKLADPKLNPGEIAEKLKEESQKDKNLTVLSARDTTINSFPSYLLRIKSVDKDPNQVAIVELIWLKYSKEVVFQLVGISASPLHKTTHLALCSFNKLKPEERLRVKRYTLKIVEAHANESIEKISLRTGNQLKPAYTSLINSHDLRSNLKAGELLKIVTVGPYR
jgi:predicted Zn-dependent protease